MKIRNKLLLTIGPIWVLSLIVAFFSALHISLLGYILFGIISSVLLSTLVYALIIKKVEQLSDCSASNLATSGNDEFAMIAKKIQDAKAEFTIPLIQKKIEKQHTRYMRLARYDHFTSLANCTLFNEILSKSISHAKRHNKILAILFIDVADKKNVNLNNLINRELGNRLVTILRTEDIIAKLEGNAFIVLLSDIGNTNFASTVAEKIIRVCSRVIKNELEEVLLTANIGISIYPNDGESLEILIENTYKALHAAKQTGPNVYRYFTQQMDIEAHDYIKIEVALRQAIQNKEMRLYFQPKINLKSGVINGVEGLVRWMSPEFGIVNPANFIPIAEQTGLMMQLGEWIMREACRTNKSWQDQGYEPITISLNLSVKQFYHPAIAAIIATILRETGLNPKYLELEITEATIMNNLEIATRVLTEIKATGVRLAIDHFGTGYTSISHLKYFPMSVIKIDQSYIKGIPDNLDDAAITSAIVALVHKLDLEVVAEGVETIEQLQYLLTHHCDMVQGYYLSYPLPADKVVLQFKKAKERVIS